MAIKRMPWYIMLRKSLKNYWFSLKFQPPLLLQPLLLMSEVVDDHDMASKVQRWERLKENHGYFNYRYNELGLKIPNDLQLHIEIRNL